MRVRPPAAGFETLALYWDKSRIERMTARPRIRAAAFLPQRLSRRVHREMDEAGVRLGVITGRQAGGRMGRVDNEAIARLPVITPVDSWRMPASTSRTSTRRAPNCAAFWTQGIQGGGDRVGLRRCAVVCRRSLARCSVRRLRGRRRCRCCSWPAATQAPTSPTAIPCRSTGWPRGIRSSRSSPRMAPGPGSTKYSGWRTDGRTYGFPRTCTCSCRAGRCTSRPPTHTCASASCSAQPIPRCPSRKRSSVSAHAACAGRRRRRALPQCRTLAGNGRLIAMLRFPARGRE